MDQHSHLQLKKNFKLVKTAEVTRVGYSEVRVQASVKTAGLVTTI